MTDLEIKEKYGEVFEITVDDKKAYLRKPNRYVLSPVLAKLNTDPVNAYENLYAACVISEISDPAILAQDELFLSAMQQMDGLIALKKSSMRAI